VKNDTSFRLSATSADANGINYIWFLNGKQKSGVNGSVFEGSGVVGTNKVQVVAVDEALNQSLHRSEIWEWVVVEEATDVEFGGGVCVKVNPETGATNSVVFTALNFKPGETCTFTLSGFDSSTQEIPDFNMWFVVCDELGGELDYVKANPSATFDSDHGELTVSLPASATEGKDSFFILGIDNKGKE